MISAMSITSCTSSTWYVVRNCLISFTADITLDYPRIVLGGIRASQLWKIVNLNRSIEIPAKPDGECDKQQAPRRFPRHPHTLCEHADEEEDAPDHDSSFSCASMYFFEAALKFSLTTSQRTSTGSHSWKLGQRFSSMWRRSLNISSASAKSSFIAA